MSTVSTHDTKLALSTLEMSVADGIAHLVMKRPEAMNTLNLSLAQDLLQAAIACESDRSIRVVVLSGEGKAFCAGGDLRAMQERSADVGAFLLELTTNLHSAIALFTQMNAPVIAAVNGTTAGAGVGLVAMADLAVAARSARFTLSYTGVGLTPDGSTTFYLPRLIGVKRTMELMLLNRTLSADEACQWGIVNQVVDDDALVAHVAHLAQKLAAGPSNAFGTVKRLLAASYGALESQLTLESRAIAAQSEHAEGREGIAAFLAKRKPKFS